MIRSISVEKRPAKAAACKPGGIALAPHPDQAEPQHSRRVVLNTSSEIMIDPQHRYYLGVFLRTWSACFAATLIFLL